MHLLKQKTCWGRFKLSLSRNFNKILPFNADLVFASYRFDHNVYSILEFSRYLFFFSIFALLTYFFLLSVHIGNTSSALSESCKLFLPCSLYYSRFTVADKNVYVIAFFSLCIILFLGTFLKWIRYKKTHSLETLFNSNTKLFAKMFLSPWSWNIDNEDLMKEAKEQLKLRLTAGVQEFNIAQTIKGRENSYYYKLYAWRTLSVTLTVVLLVAAGGGIFYLYLIASQFEDDGSIMSLLYSFIPPIGIVLIKGVLPYLFDFFVYYFEKWDYPSTELNQLIWRNFFTKTFSLFVVYFINVYFISLKNTEILGIEFKSSFTCGSLEITEDSTPSGNTGTAVANTSYSTCREDEVAYNLFLNVQF